MGERNKDVLKEAYERASLKKNNRLIEGVYHAKPREDKMIYLGMLKIQEGDYRVRDDGKVVVGMKAGELAEYLGWTKRKSLYADLLEMADGMTSRKIVIRDDENRSFVYWTLIPGASYANGVFSLYFDPLILELGMCMNDSFTMLPARVVKKLNGTYTFQTYQTLKREMYYSKSYRGQRDGLFTYTVSVPKLKVDIGVVDADNPKIRKIMRKKDLGEKDYAEMVAASKEEKFRKWNDFERYCLKKAVKEINENSDITVAYEKIKAGQGAKVAGVTFTMKYKDAVPCGKDEQEKKEGKWEEFLLAAGETAKKQGLSVDDIRVLAEDCGYDPEKLENASRILENAENVVSPMGFLRAAIKKSYEVTEKGGSSERNHKIHNFPERNCDYNAVLKAMMPS